MSRIWGILMLVLSGARTAATLNEIRQSTDPVEVKKENAEKAIQKFHLAATKYAASTPEQWDDSIVAGAEKFIDEIASAFVDGLKG